MFLSGLNIIEILNLNMSFIGRLITNPVFLAVTLMSVLFIAAKNNYDARQKITRLQHEKDLTQRQRVVQNAQQSNFVKHMIHRQK